MKWWRVRLSAFGQSSPFARRSGLRTPIVIGSAVSYVWDLMAFDS